MNLTAVLLSFLLLSLASCSKNGQEPVATSPPVTETNWKLTRIFGGFMGEEKAMNDDQKNSILVIRSDGSYNCRNLVTGLTTTGVLTITSADNILIEYKFNPKLRIYPTTAFWLNEKTTATMMLGETNPDGYTLTFSRQ
jgi:hypothetical protein